ncbi:MAG: T9SS type A sorting domain-containing protein [Bacteroidota bacterium]
MDTLDNNLDPYSILPEQNKEYYSAFNFSLNGQVATFDFPSIYLPDSTRDEPGSHGFISFTVKLKHGLHIGDEIRNKGFIYFDFNEAIITNTVINTIQSLIPVEEIQFSPEALAVFPDPVTDHFQISYADGINMNVMLSLYDALGRKIYQRAATGVERNQHKIELSARSIGIREGIYVAEINNGERVLRKKFVCAN